MFNRLIRPFCVSVVVLLQACGSSTTGNSSSSGGAPSAGSGGSGQSAGTSNGGNANTAGGSDIDAGPPCPDGEARVGGSTECTPVKRLFVTRSQYTGDFVSQAPGSKDGLDAADALCNASAQKAGLSGQYRAWLSTSTVNAIDRITDVGPWYLVNHYSGPLFANKAAIIAGKPGQNMGIGLAEDGLGVESDAGGASVWTGTAPDGTNHNDTAAKPNAFCQDWTSALRTDNGTYGFENHAVSDPTWTQFPDAYGFCNALLRLYCFEQ